MNADTLLGRVKSGERLTRRELDFVRNALANDKTQEDKYTLIHILWKAYDAPSRDLILAHVNNPDDMVRRIALQALAVLPPHDEVFELALRMTQDPSKYVRMVATRVIGTLGAVLPQRVGDAARFLLAGFERHRSTTDADWEFYYEGLLELLQVPLRERPPATRSLGGGDIQPEVVVKARSLAGMS